MQICALAASKAADTVRSVMTKTQTRSAGRTNTPTGDMCVGVRLSGPAVIISRDVSVVLASSSVCESLFSGSGHVSLLKNCGSFL